jgi:excisionase family DNA binding protein
MRDIKLINGIIIERVPREHKGYVQRARRGGTAMPPTCRYLTVHEAAVAVRKSEHTIYRWLRQGKLPARRIMRSWRIPQEAVDQLLTGTAGKPIEAFCRACGQDARYEVLAFYAPPPSMMGGQYSIIRCLECERIAFYECCGGQQVLHVPRDGRCIPLIAPTP